MKWVKLYLSKILWSKYIFGRPLGTLHRRCMSMPHWKWTPYSIALFCYVQCFMKLVLDQNNSTSILFWFSLFQTMNNNFWDVKWYKWFKIKKKKYIGDSCIFLEYDVNTTCIQNTITFVIRSEPRNKYNNNIF